MNNQVTDVLSYLHYFQALAADHVSIKDFYIMDINEPLSALRDRMKYPCLIMNSLSGNFNSPNLDNILDQITGGFLILGHLDNIDDFSAEMILLQEMKQIGTDLIARMNHDLLKCEPRAVKAIPGFNINSVGYQMMDGIFDNCFGFLFTFKVYSAMNIDFDPTKWVVSPVPSGQFPY